VPGEKRPKTVLKQLLGNSGLEWRLQYTKNIGSMFFYECVEKGENLDGEVALAGWQTKSMYSRAGTNARGRKRGKSVS
jgi:hypothetical protein